MSTAEIIINYDIPETEPETDGDEVEEGVDHDDGSFPIFVELRSLKASNIL